MVKQRSWRKCSPSCRSYSTRSRGLIDEPTMEESRTPMADVGDGIIDADD
jgi:hypothetical protein